MAVQKLSSTDAFVVVDFPDAPASGVVRRARKILQSSATDLARSATYTFGVFGVERGGASAGINAEGDAVPGSVEAFVAELQHRAAAGDLRLIAGKGVEPDQIASLSPTTGPAAGVTDEVLLVAGVVAAAAWSVGGSLAGRPVAIEAPDQAPSSLATALAGVGAEVVDVSGVDEKPWLVWGADVDLVLAGSKPGVLSHQGAGMVTAQVVVPWGPIPVTTKAFAQLRRTGRVQVVPDFVSTAGPLLADVVAAELGSSDPSAVIDGSTIVDQVGGRIVEVLDGCAGDPDGLLLGACYRAEAFLQEWRGAKPFGRPLAA